MGARITQSCKQSQESRLFKEKPTSVIPELHADTGSPVQSFHEANNERELSFRQFDGTNLFLPAQKFIDIDVENRSNQILHNQYSSLKPLKGILRSQSVDKCLQPKKHVKFICTIQERKNRHQLNRKARKL